MKTKKKNKLPKWFRGDVYPKGDTVKNPFSGEVCELTAEELSMYDLIIGCQFILEMNKGYESTGTVVKDMRKGLDWFRKNNAKAYMILLD